jgi:putative membrane protein
VRQREAAAFPTTDLEEHVMDKRNTIRISKIGAFALAVSTLGAGVTGPAMAASTASGQGSLDDAQIARRVLALSRSEERTAEAVRGKLVSPAVWQLAERISVDHAAVDEKFEKFVPADRGTDTAGLPDARAERLDLSKLSGDDLEVAYADHEVKSHEAMLAAIDRELIPAARSGELQRQLADLRLEVAAHLQSARNVQHAEWTRRTLEEQRAEIDKEVGNDGP